MARVQLEPAWVLSLRAYRESSALLEVLTPVHGRVGLVARGIRGAKSKLRGLLQPFAPLLLSWSERGELGTLSGAESGGATSALRGEAIFAGWYLNELVLRLLPRHVPHPALFKDYSAALSCLGSEGASAGVSAKTQMPPALAHGASRALRVFEKRLLDELGYGLHLPEGLSAEGWYTFEPASSGLRVAEGPASNAYRGASLMEIESESFASNDALRDARRLLRSALEPHLNGRALRTPEMLRALRSLREPG